MKRNNLSREDVCVAINVTQKTLTSYINNLESIQLKTIIPLAGLFNIPVEQLVYMLVRNKPSLNKSDKWYIEEKRQAYKHITDDE